MKSSIISILLIGGFFVVSGCRRSESAENGNSDLVILKATYGVGISNTVDVTTEIRNLASSGPIRLHPQWALAIDPAYGKTKRLTIAYRYKGKLDVASFDQFEEVEVPLPPNGG